MLASLQRWQVWLSNRWRHVRPSEGPGFLRALLRYELRRGRPCRALQTGRSAPYLSVLYPSCRPHKAMLELSLRSLCKVGFPIARLCLLNDCDQPLLAEDIADLRLIWPALEVLPSREGLRLDTPRILAELEGLRQLSDALAPDSWVMKVDSDTLFLDARLFRRVMAYEGALFGHPVVNPRGSDNLFAQGGAMFFRVRLLRRMVRSSTVLPLLRTCWRAGRPLDRCPEDNFLFKLAAGLTDQIQLERFMFGMEPPFDLKRLDGESMIHFEDTHKRHMLDYAETMGLGVPSRPLL